MTGLLHGLIFNPKEVHMSMWVTQTVYMYSPLMLEHKYREQLLQFGAAQLTLK